MSRVFGKLVSKLVALIVIVIFVLSVKNLIITDSAVGDFFDELMEQLPFAKITTDAVTRLMKCQQDLAPQFTQQRIITDLLKLAVMASIQPLFTALLSLIFLKVPGGSIDEREDFMRGLPYQLKETLITIVTAPILAFAAARIISYASDHLTAKLGSFVSSLIGVVSVIVMSFLSTVPLLLFGTITFGLALLWRLFVTIFGKMIIILGMDAICIWMYISIVTGVHSQTFLSIASLVVFLIIMETGLSFLKQAIARKSLADQ